MWPRSSIFIVFSCWLWSGSLSSVNSCSDIEAERVAEIWNNVVPGLDSSGRVAIIHDVVKQLERSTPMAAIHLKNLFPVHPSEVHQLQEEPEDELEGIDPENITLEHLAAGRERRVVQYLQILSEFDQLINLLTRPAVLEHQSKHFISARKIKRGLVTDSIAASAKALINTLAKINDNIDKPTWTRCLKRVTECITDIAPLNKQSFVSASCQISPNSGDPAQPIEGTIEFTQQIDGDDRRLFMLVQLKGFDTTDDNLEHGFHIHTRGDLDDGCKAAEGHYNPHDTQHGGPHMKMRHVGDLGNIKESDDGTVDIIIHDHMASLLGEQSIIGRSIVIHAEKDDFGEGGHPDSLTTGHAGVRVACCVIKEMQAPTTGYKHVHEDL